MTKLSPITIILIGVAIAIVALSYAFFLEWMPKRQEAAYNREYKQQLEAEVAKMASARQRREQAIQMVNEKARQWNETVMVKTPPSSLASGGIDLNVHGWQLTVDTLKFRNSIQRQVNAQLKKGGVSVLNGPLVPQPTTSASAILSDFFNYPAFTFPIVIFDFGTIQVRGTYDQIMANVRAWKDMPNFLAVTDGLQIQGTSPILTASYNLSIVGYIRGREIFPRVPEGGSGGGGGGGRPAGGMPGPGGRMNVAG